MLYEAGNPKWKSRLDRLVGQGRLAQPPYYDRRAHILEKTNSNDKDFTLKPQTATKLALKRVLRRAIRFVPTPHWTDRYPDLNRLEKTKMSVMSRTLLKHSGHMVFGGPFSTMKLAENLDLAWDPKIIVGSYEQEVHEVINDVICMAPLHIIIIGAAFGYYAVGFALKIADTTITAFEAVEVPHWQQLNDLARLNRVSAKIIQRGLCTAADLAKTCTPQSFILCDCEGGEMDILDPVGTPALRSCKILFELHEFYRPNLVATLISRFRESHHIRIIEEAERNPSRYRILNKLPRGWRSVAIQETKWIPSASSRTVTWLRFMLLTPKG
jgi:hypothetical protein